jgi:hypothetical protein
VATSVAGGFNASNMPVHLVGEIFYCFIKTEKVGSAWKKIFPRKTELDEQILWCQE